MTFSRRELTGIFISVAVMALILAVLRFSGGDALALPTFESNQGSVIVAGEDSTAVEEALGDSVSQSGSLEKLIVDDVRIGTGEVVKEGDEITVHYIGSTRDGRQFDNSYEKGETFTFTVGAGRVIEGWEKGVIGMRVGGQRILVVPPELAYGNRQVGPISPNSPLVFAIELLSIE